MMAMFGLGQTLNPIERHFSTITRYQYYIYAIIFASKFPIFMHVLSILFLTPPMKYSCDVGGTKTENGCPCPNPEWDLSVFTKTIQTKYNVICGQKWMVSFSESCISLGSLCGAFSFGFLSDKFGRRIMFSMACLIIAITGCLVIVMPSMATFIFMRYLQGIGLGGSIVTSYVFLVEYCGLQHREMVSALYHVPINMGHMCTALVSYMLRDCDHFQLAITLPAFIFALTRFLTLESPKWLMDNGRLDEAATVMEKILKFNKKPDSSVRGEITSYAASKSQSSSHKVKFREIFKYRRLTINFFCMAYIYFVCGMGYYGVSQYIGRMSGDIHANVAISGALLIPGTVAASFLLKIIGRRTFLMTTNGVSGTLMLVVLCIPAEYGLARVGVACICNCFFFMSFIIVFLYGVELFPTSVRNSVLGILSTTSRLGQIVAPPVNHLPQIVSGCIFGVAALLGAVMCYPLPETKNVELPSTLEDTERQAASR